MIIQPNELGSMFHFMNNIEKIIIQDEQIMRLLVYEPEGYDEEKSQRILDPLNPALPNIVDDSEEYWHVVTTRVRKGDKRTNLDTEAKCIMYIQEGRDRSKFGNDYMVSQEVIISILIHETYESDWRMSRIRDRLMQLLIHKQEMAGFGKFNYTGGDPRDAPKEYRRMDYVFLFTNNKKPLYDGGGLA